MDNLTDPRVMQGEPPSFFLGMPALQCHVGTILASLKQTQGRDLALCRNSKEMNAMLC